MSVRQEFSLNVKNKLDVALLGNLRNGPIADWQDNWVGFPKNYKVGDMVYYTDSTVYICHTDTVANDLPTDITYWYPLSGSGSVVFPTLTDAELQRANKADFTFESSGLHVDVYPGDNPDGGFNPSIPPGARLGNKALIGFGYSGGTNPLTGVKLDTFEYLRVKVHGLERAVQSGTSVVGPGGVDIQLFADATNMRFAKDNLFYLNLSLATSAGNKILSGGFYAGAQSDGTGNPSNLPVESVVKDITFRPGDRIWAIVGPADLGLPSISSVTYQGGGNPGLTLNAMGDFTDWNIATFNAFPDPGVPVGKDIQPITLSIGGSTTNDRLSFRILELEYRVNGVTTVHVFASE